MDIALMVGNYHHKRVRGLRDTVSGGPVKIIKANGEVSYGPPGYWDDEGKTHVCFVGQRRKHRKEVN